MQLSPRIHVKTNTLLKGPGPTMKLEDLLNVRQAVAPKGEAAGDGGVNLSSIPEETIRDVYSIYGSAGLYKLFFLAMGHDQRNFQHFFRLISNTISLGWIGPVENETKFQCDNDKLPEGEDMARYNSHIFQPSLARKLYNPGLHPGYFVYGLGGPKILISHPFQGINGEFYDVYNNSIDVVTSLMVLGYSGTFLLLDNMLGLNFKVDGVPAWVIWFSKIASHSDAVLFIKEYQSDFGESQKKEIEFTPNRVQKKIVAISHEELLWAAKPREGAADIYSDGKKEISKEAFYKLEAEHAEPLILEYAISGWPKDRLFRIDESNNVTQYPLNFQIYGAALL